MTVYAAALHLGSIGLTIALLALVIWLIIRFTRRYRIRVEKKSAPTERSSDEYSATRDT